ncbi:hypothetical protein [Streptomyces sp. ALI-76-A]|jgi:hypothetical protein|uniref:hypothetical protein n=1 Tax=Streptomyces sp. ALI-76-A TaxID=3025736 RepID=UPI00256F0D02|nr:hypothetical protein [Streptomyces sp. ALI-76-A]MDL5199199.1 hypothetical protein [Streptomyces sp. ALI-76-A]
MLSRATPCAGCTDAIRGPLAATGAPTSGAMSDMTVTEHSPTTYRSFSRRTHDFVR